MYVGSIETDGTAGKGTEAFSLINLFKNETLTAPRNGTLNPSDYFLLTLGHHIGSSVVKESSEEGCLEV